MSYSQFSSTSERERPIYFMLMTAESGLSLISKSFDSHFDVDDSLVSGILTALNTCSGEIFSQTLEKLCFGDYTLLIRLEQPFLFCYIFKGDCDSADLRLREIINHLKLDIDFWSSLMNTMNTGTVDRRALFRIETFLTHMLRHSAY